MKRVLIITYYWPPSGGGGVQRWVKFVKYLNEFGWEPIVFTVENGNYPVIDHSLMSEISSDIEVLRSPILEPYQLYNKFSKKSKGANIDPNFLTQGKTLSLRDKISVWVRGNIFIPDARAFWIKPSIKRIAKYLKNHSIDAIISTGPPHSCHLIAQGIHKRFGTPWIVDYRDPWTQVEYFSELKLSYFARKLHERLEKGVLNNCNAIVTVGKTMALDLESITNNKKVVITNGFDEADRALINTDLDEAFTITYIGTMNSVRNPEALWYAVAKLKESHHPLIDRIKIKIIGKSEEIIQKSVELFGLSDIVEFCGYLSHKDAIAHQNSARVLLLVINKTTNNRSILTGKIFEYLASGRPILCIGPKDGDAAEIIKESHGKIVFDYEDVDGIISFLIEEYNGYLSNTKEQHKGDINIYSRKELTRKLSSLLDDITR